MYIQTNRGKLEVMAWHIGRHVMIVTPGGMHFRIDGKPVAEIYRALQTNGKQAIEVDASPTRYINIFLQVSDSGCEITVNDNQVMRLDHKAHMELLAIFETAFVQSDKGLQDMHEEEERRRYGLPPKDD